MQKLFTLKSGLKLILIKNTAVRSVAMGVFVGAGVVNEEKDLAGISHFIEHMVFKGTKKRSSFDIVNEVDSIGAQINAFTTKSYTAFHTVSLDSNLSKCADVLSDLYLNPTFDEEELKKERNVVIEEINESEDTPDDVCIEQLFSTFYKNCALEKAILGTKKTLKGMNRDTLKAYHSKYYVPSNTVVVIAGNCSEEKALEIVNVYFESKFDREYLPVAREKIIPTTQNISVGKSKDIEQAHLAFAFPAYPYNSVKGVAVQLMSVIFSMEMSSRLFQSVRERLGLCYTIMGYPSTYKDSGAFMIYTATNPQSVESATLAIKDEIDLLIKDGISDEELMKGKEQLKTSLVLGQESTASMMRAFGAHAMQTGELYDFDKRISMIDAITKDDVLNVAREIFNYDKMCASIVAKNSKVDLVKLIKKDFVGVEG